MNLRFLTLFCLVLALGRCASKPASETAGLQEGQWQAKALIRDKEKSRSYLVHLNMNAVRDERARIDVTSTLGTGLASLVVTNQEVRYVLLDQKRFYSGRPKPDAMKPILAMPFDPRWLHNLLFGEKLDGPGWSCKTEGAVQTCHDAGTDTDVTWDADARQRRILRIEHPKASVQINVQSFRPKVEDRPNLFVLNAPEGYQKTSLK